ncbi:MAG: CHAP domain-containing protein [Kofleriaceae bacterium]|nr:CHAP domain-containing protein [Kofleriaceae bacterium]
MRALLCLLALTLSAAAEVPRSQQTWELPTHEGVPWPIQLVPVDGPLPDAPDDDMKPPPAATRAGSRILTVLDDVQRTLVRSKYQPSTRVNKEDGTYNWDCSGMAAWVMRRSAPRALAALASTRPVARDFASAIERAPTRGTRNGWQRIARVADVLPGDIFAWKRPRGLPSKNTGHVGFVVGRPLPVPGIPNAWAVRIADSTSSFHQDDTRRDDLDGGFGIGTLVFLTDAEGRAISYGWAGTKTEWYIVTPVVFGRVDR